MSINKRLYAATAALLVAAVFGASTPASATERHDAAAATERHDTASATDRHDTATATDRQAAVNPVVLFPAYAYTRLKATVAGQTTDPACPATGDFEIQAGEDDSSTFSSICRDELITLRYHRSPKTPWSQRFSEQPGVTTSIPDYGSTRSAPFYETLYSTLERAGYVRDRSIRVAGYDFRLTPDQGGFLPRAIQLIEQTSRANGGRPVQLVGHSNGPLYIQYLLTHVSPRWKQRYVHGFTALAGNFPGQGSLYPVLFTGLDLVDFSFPATAAKAASSARLLRNAPSTYMSAADPKIFGRREVVVHDESTGRSYTPADWPRLFADAHEPVLAEIARHYIGFVAFSDRRHFPGVDVWAEKGSGLETVVGADVTSLKPGPATGLITRDGDINQEDITNEAVAVWARDRRHHFSLTDNPGVSHFELPSDPAVLHRLVAAAA